jgi:predicted TIM-barrel fold metal-dependent hydrolase
MQTPWGDIPVFDAHVHYFSRPFFQSLAAQGGRTLEETTSILGWRAPDADPADLSGQWIAELDRHGVAGACVIASAPGDEASVIDAAMLYPERLAGYFMLNAAAADAADRAHTAVATGRIRGVCLFPAMHGYSMRDPRVVPVIEAARSRPGVVVFVHCGVLTIGVRKKLGLPSLFDMTYSNPIDLHAVALRFPQVPFVVPHFGAGYLREALMLADLCPNVYLDTSSSNGWTKYLAEGVDLRGVFRRALDVVGAGRLLFGTDSSFFPRGWHKAIFEQQAACLQALGVSESDARDIFGGNIRRLLRL